MSQSLGAEVWTWASIRLLWGGRVETEKKKCKTEKAYRHKRNRCMLWSYIAWAGLPDCVNLLRLCRSAGGQHVEDPQVSSLALLHKQQLLSCVQSEPLAAVWLEDGASVPPLLLQRPELSENYSQTHCRWGPQSHWVRVSIRVSSCLIQYLVYCFSSRYSLAPLGGVVQRLRRRPREKVSFAGDDHQDQVGRSRYRLEQHFTFLLNTWQEASRAETPAAAWRSTNQHTATPDDDDDDEAPREQSWVSLDIRHADPQTCS